MATPVPGPHRGSSQFQTATVWGKLFWPSLHPHLRAPRWSTAASQTSESSPHRVERASCRWWATSSWTWDLTRSHKNPYCIYFHSNCLAKDKLPFTKKEQNLAFRQENSRIWLRINTGGYLPSFWDVWLRTSERLSVYPQQVWSPERINQPHWHIAEIFAESFISTSTHVGSQLCTLNCH